MSAVHWCESCGAPATIPVEDAWWCGDCDRAHYDLSFREIVAPTEPGEEK